MSSPLIACKGIAKIFKSKCSGFRNRLGQFLCYRNDEWVEGTIPDLCVALSGSNNDVKPNDRLEVTEHTHESVCRKRCLGKKHHMKRTTRITQRTQSVANGYFGGFMSKNSQVDHWKPKDTSTIFSICELKREALANQNTLVHQAED